MISANLSLVFFNIMFLDYRKRPALLGAPRPILAYNILPGTGYLVLLVSAINRRAASQEVKGAVSHIECSRVGVSSLHLTTFSNLKNTTK